MWPSSVSWNWNAMDVGPGRDLVGELADAVRSTTKLRFGLYHSMFEWFNPMFKSDATNNYTTQEYVMVKYPWQPLLSSSQLHCPLKLTSCSSKYRQRLYQNCTTSSIATSLKLSGQMAHQEAPTTGTAHTSSHGCTMIRKPHIYNAPY